MPPQPERATYRKFRSRSAEDRPCVAVAAARGDDGLRVVVGAVAGTPQDFPELCDGEPAEVAAGYAERIAPMSDARGSAEYRRRVIAAEVRRAVEEVVVDPRVTGAQRYSCHAERPGMLHAAFVRSPYPHARVLSVTRSGRRRRAHAGRRRGPESLRLPGQGPARAGRRGAPHRRRGGRRGGAHPRRGPRRRAGGRGRVRRAARRLRPARGARRTADPRAVRLRGRGRLDRGAPDRGHQRLPPLPHPPRRRRRGLRGGRGRGRGDLPRRRRRPRPDGAARRRRRVGGRPPHAVERHPDPVQRAQRPCRLLRRARGRDPRHRPADGRLVRGEDLRAARGARRRPRPQGGRARQGGARPRRGVRHAQPPPGGGQGADRRPPRRHAHRQGGRLLGRHRRLRRLRPGRGDQDGLRRRRARTASRTCAWTPWRSTRTCRPTAPSAATAPRSRCGRPSARWTCWRASST